MELESIYADMNETGSDEDFRFNCQVMARTEKNLDGLYIGKLKSLVRIQDTQERILGIQTMRASISDVLL